MRIFRQAGTAARLLMSLEGARRLGKFFYTCLVLRFVEIVAGAESLWARLFPPKKISDFNVGVPSQPDGISIVVPNYNGKGYFDGLLESLFKALKHFDKSEILIVDDASSDGSVEYLREKYPSVRVIDLQENVGFGEACNIGITEAEHRTTYLLNSDMLLEENSIAPLMRSLKDPDVFAVTPRLYLWDFETLHQGLNTANMKADHFPVWNEADTLKIPAVKKASPTFYAVGAAILTDREKFLALGGFDPLYLPFCWEDIDISYRAWKRGWKVIYEPASIAYHKHHGTLETVTDRSSKLPIESKNSLLFMVKNIHDRRLLHEHINYVLRFSKQGLASGEFEYYAASTLVLKQLIEVLRKRMKERRYALVPDGDIFDMVYEVYCTAAKENGIEVARP